MGTTYIYWYYIYDIKYHKYSVLTNISLKIISINLYINLLKFREINKCITSFTLKNVSLKQFIKRPKRVPYKILLLYIKNYPNNIRTEVLLWKEIWFSQQDHRSMSTSLELYPVP